MKLLIPFCLVGVFYILCFFSANAAEYTLWFGGSPNSRVNFEASTITAALKASEDEFGPTQLLLNHRPYTEQRAAILIERGDFQMRVTTHYPPSIPQYKNLLWVDHPLLTGLLPFRKLVVHKSMLKKIEPVSNIVDLRQLRIGQVKNWADNQIYKDARITLRTSENLDTLFNMLSAKRFDLLPLGLHEINEILNRQTDHHPDLTIAKNLMLYYPIPGYILISPKYPELASRLEAGLQKLTKQNWFETHLKKINNSELKEIMNPQTKIISLTGSPIPFRH